MLKRLKPWLDMALMTDDEEAGGAGGVVAYPEQGKGHFFLQCWRGSSASESECRRRRRLLWGYLLLMTRKLTTESEAGLACSTYHVAYASCVCVFVRVCCLSVFRYRASVASNDSKTMPAVCWLLDACLFARLCRDFPRPSFFFVVFLLFLAFHLWHRQTRHINELWSLHRVQRMKCILSLAGIMRRNYRQSGEGGQMWGEAAAPTMPHAFHSLSFTLCLSLSWFCIYPWK